MEINSPREFWNRRILIWDGERYERRRFSRPIRGRHELAQKLLRDHLRSRRVLELGCGTGRMAEYCLDQGAKEYWGIDFSFSAIQAAKARCINDRCFFREQDVLDLSMDVDVCFSLGLLDWLTQDEIQLLFTKIRAPFQLHSFSEERISFSRLAHRAYTLASYGFRNPKYTPRYESAHWLRETLSSHIEGTEILRSRELGIGAFLHNLGE